jgi:phosphohistidine phosphatase SixA
MQIKDSGNRGLFFEFHLTTIDMDEVTGQSMSTKRFSIRKWMVYTGIVLAAAILLLTFSLHLFTPVTTVFLVRHAEKHTRPADDPPLTALGLERARSLYRILQKLKISAIYSTRYDRTRQTALPLAEALDLPVIEYEAKDFEGLVDRIRSDHAGEVVLVVGHSNTVPPIIEAFGCDPVLPIADNAYDNLFAVTLFRGKKPRVFILKYGQPSQNRTKTYRMKLVPE